MNDRRRAPGRNPTIIEPSSDLDAERTGWYEVLQLVQQLTPDECLEPGYYLDPGWTVRDLVAHLGTWLAEAKVQLERIAAGTYEGHGIDLDAVNASLLAGMTGQSWETAWTQAHAARTEMLHVWSELTVRDDEVDWWIRKSGADHYAEHLERLRGWQAELLVRRTRVAAGE